MKSQIQSVEVTYFVNETEDPEKVRSAAAWLLGLDPSPESEVLDGHFGNKIMNVRIHLVGEEAEKAVRRIFASMSEKLRGELEAELSSFVDEHSALFLRFDKQRLVLGELAFANRDPVRVKVKPRLFRMKSAAPEFYGRMLEGSGSA